MTNFPNDPTDLLLDFESLPVETIFLESDKIDRAVQLSSQIVNEFRQWQIYLNALALFGFEQWLSERAAELRVNSENCTVLQPQYANAIAADCNLEVGEFKLCLLATGTLIDEAIAFPRAAIDLPEYAAHFYVLVEVREEQEQATIKSFIRHDQLVDRLQSANLQAEPDWTYELPYAWFDRDPDRLLLYLRCLEPTAIPLPAIPTNRLASLSGIQAELEPLIPQLQSPNRPLWKVLTWEQGAALLSSPELLDWLYCLQTEAQPIGQLSQILQNLTQQVVNVWLWLQDELDEFAQNLSWMVLPPPDLATVPLRSLRDTVVESPAEEFGAIIAQLRSRGMEIPTQARGAYRDLTLAENLLRLYAVTWSIPIQSEWTLLLILGTRSGNELPQGLKLRVSELTNVLVEVEPNPGDTYLYTRVVGALNEQFLVTLVLMDGETLTLPSFAFIREESQ
ncbi:Protein of unknown function (DUF1822) [Pleurocapsa sp. PCC 7327]|uniref:DUF1822 family protein n=1 Tax=Pleurocapsa sp. PCC 7327 TaxID=118163 RepID=UPI00029FE0C3|nr:DUF1822 family protein [Pleurocapsa sp. PCC 7327]AFY78245.1 Protein of unknown function (DUF1822) [Pleurocapsa sp. PCC 7327]